MTLTPEMYERIWALLSDTYSRNRQHGIPNYKSGFLNVAAFLGVRFNEFEVWARGREWS